MRIRTYLPLLGLALLLTFSAFSQLRSPFVPELSYLQRENLKGAIKLVNTKSYSIKEKKGALYDAYQSSHIITTFDKKGNRTEEEKFLGDSSKSGSAKKIYHYNSQGFAIETSFYIRGKQDGKSVLKLDKKGNVKESQLLDADGNNLRRVVNRLDENGRKKEMWQYHLNDSFPRKTLFYYYKEDNKTSEKHYGKNGVFLAWSTYTFNEKGLLIQEMKYEEGGGPIGRVLYTYDARGNLLERLESVRNANNTTRYTYTWDENDNVTSEKKFDKNEQLLEAKMYGYLYDAKGNWMEKLEVVDGVEKNLYKRTISYY